MAKQYLNIQEQVQKNKDDIERILNKEGVLNEFGITVVGQEESIDDLPTVAEYKEAHSDWKYGDTYAIGEEEPYELYILTRANDTHPDDYWFDLGQFPLPGPQGETGETGEQGPPGAAGEIIGASASIGTDATGTPSASVTLGGTPTVRTFAFSFKNLIGPQGPQGDPGAFFNIAGQVANASLLPSAADVPTTQAYMVGASTPYDVYCIMTVSGVKSWLNLGPVAVVESDTKVGSSVYSASGTLNSLVLDEIVNNASWDAIKIGDVIFAKHSPGFYYCIKDVSGTITVYCMNINLSTGAWSITTQAIGDVDNVPSKQATWAIIRSPLKNINTVSGNGLGDSGYTAVYTTISGYVCYQIRYNNSNLNLDAAKFYMKFMTGSEFVPTFSTTVPSYTYFIDGDGWLYKVQFDNTNGLLLYIMKQVVDNSSDQNIGGNKIFTGNTTLSGVLNPNSTGKGLTLPNTTSFTANEEIATKKYVDDKAFNVINVSDIASNNILTQAQYDIISNGKPTILAGSYWGYNSPVLLSLEISGTTRRGFYIGGNNLGAFGINTATKELMLYSSSQLFLSLRSIWAINGKEIPSYPSSPTRDQVLVYGTDNILKYVDKPQGLWKHRIRIYPDAHDLTEWFEGFYWDTTYQAGGTMPDTDAAYSNLVALANRNNILFYESNADYQTPRQGESVSVKLCIVGWDVINGSTHVLTVLLMDGRSGTNNVHTGTIIPELITDDTSF